MQNNALIRLCCCAGIVLLLGSGMRAEENVDRFILPETPPTIERLKKPPLDRPVLRKQNFVSDSDISLPPVLLNLNFYRFYSDEHPVSIGIYHGSFATLGGHFAFSSPRGFRMGYAADYSSGERPNLSREKNAFQYAMERPVGDSLKVSGSVETGESVRWTQHKDYVSLGSKAAWYLRNNLNAAVAATYTKAEIRDMEANESWTGRCELSWQPQDGHSVVVSYAPVRDTAFGEGNEFSTLGFEYDCMLGSRLVLGGGYRLQNGSLFPLARAVWSVVPRLRFTAVYEPGIERPSWYDLYLAQDAFVRSVPGLPFPESAFRMHEGLSYYWDERGSLDLEFTQESVENYRYWQKDAVSDYIVPAALPGEYVSTCRLGFNYRWEAFAPRVGLTFRSDNARPLVPAYVLSSGLVWTRKAWTVAAAYDLVSSRYAALGGDRKLEAYGDCSLSVSKTIAQGIDVFAAGENLLGQTIEAQPGFVRSAVNFRAGTTIKF